MSKPIAEGDRVRIIDREQVAADIKSQLFYEHYRNLVGAVGKIYADGTASVNIDMDSLTKEMGQRHNGTADTLRTRWLDGMSEEGRGKLSASEKSFTLRYTILIAVSDLEAYVGTEKPSPSAKPKLEAPVEPARKTLAELDAEEAKHFEELQKHKNS